MDLSHISSLAARYLVDQSDRPQGLPGLSIYLRDDVSAIEAMIYEPVICLILQGGKAVRSGDQRVDLGPGDALLVSHDLPVVSRITKANKREPYIALLLSIDLGVVRGLYEQVAAVNLPEVKALSLSAQHADPTWFAPLVRYLELMDSPMDAQVLGASVLREIHYRLLLAPIGGMLRRLLIADSHASRIAKAIQMLRNGFRSRLSVADLANHAGMSPSSFHKHFRVVTSTTPLQYQKDLRLIEARASLIDTGRSVSQTAYAVGYESATQFSRDYSRKFGVPPSQDSGSAFPVSRHGSI